MRNTLRDNAAQNAQVDTGLLDKARRHATYSQAAHILCLATYLTL
jgi:hypothetical protein